MNKRRQIFMFYGALVLVSMLLFASVRWFSYRTPKSEASTREYEIKYTDPMLANLNLPPNENTYYYVRETITTTVSAGIFPFLHKEEKMERTLYQHPIWNE